MKGLLALVTIATPQALFKETAAHLRLAAWTVLRSSAGWMISEAAEDQW